MANKVNRNLAGRFNKFVNRRRKDDDKRAGFKNEIDGRLSADKTKGDERKRVRRDSGRRSSRRSAVGRGKARASYQKHITKQQAMRIAKYAPIIEQAARRYQVPIELITGVILQESGGKLKAVSHCGARGLMQLMPATAKRLGVKNSFDPAQNIMGGTKYLRMLLNRFDGNVALTLAGYNAGEGNVEKYGRRIPPFKETKAYVPNVLKYADTIWRLMRVPVKRVTFHPRAIRHKNPVVIHRTIYSTSQRV